MHIRKFRAIAGILTLVSALTLGSGSPAAAETAHPGAPGIGDYLFPGLGNGGYDARHYTLNLRYPNPTAAPEGQVHGMVRMDATSTQALSSFNLDFAGDTIASVRVEGRPARFDWQRPAEELVITPSRAIRRGQAFTVQVAFTAHPSTPAPDNTFPVGWIATQGGSSFSSFQPNLAHHAFPVSDHPSDKATYAFGLDVPRGMTAVANGVPAGKRTSASRTVFTYVERSPLAAELIQLAVGDYSIVQRGTVAGVAYRDVIANTQRGLLKPAFAQGPAQLTWAAGKIGRFPHAIYGNLGVDQRFGYSLETQGISLHSVGLFDPNFLPGRTGQEWFYNAIMVHEIAHEWFGDSVSPSRWSDIWLNEGFATYIEKLYEQDHGTLDEWGHPSLEAYMRDQYGQGDTLRTQYGPVARPLSADTVYSPLVYDGAALVLYALQQRVGDDTFHRIVQGWPRQFRGTSASTDDFITFASRTSGQNLSGFLGAWLYGTRTPPMPGHPDWTVAPPTAAETTTGMDDRERSTMRTRTFTLAPK